MGRCVFSARSQAAAQHNDRLCQSQLYSSSYLQGLQVLGVGYARVTAEGMVYGLQSIEEFEGVYAAVEASAAAGSGPSAVVMQNPHDVAIYLHATQEGVQFTLAAGGVEIKLKR